MATTTPTKMTIEEFLALPEEDGVHRELIDGELREYSMTTRNAKHAYAIGRITQALGNWLDEQADLTGVVVAGDARCQLFRDSETVVGIDVAIFLGEDALDTVARGGSFMGPPVLAVEVLSPSDTNENVTEKIQAYLEARTSLIWVVDPGFQTIMVYRPDDEPVLFNRRQTISGQPELPGFEADVSSFFAVKKA